MVRVAIRMLMGERGKFFGIIFGVTFASLLMAQQMSIFCGLMRLTTVQIREIRGGDLWVMDPDVLSIDDYKPLADTALYRIRSVPGVEWAVPLFRGVTRMRLTAGPVMAQQLRDAAIGPDSDPAAVLQQVILLGLDDTTLIGLPSQADMVVGSVNRIREPDAILIDAYSCKLLWPEEGDTLKRPEDYRRFLGRTCELTDNQAVIIGVCGSRPNFQTLPVVYTTFSHAKQFVPPGRKLTSFVLAKVRGGIDPREVCRDITERTGLKALTNEDFTWATIRYYLTRTGIPLNFGITVLLGFFVGTAIAGLTFYQFTIENLKQFAVMKAMGMSNGRILGMILLQALIIGPIGYSLGVGLAATFGEIFKDDPTLAYFMPWQVLALTAAAVLLICVLSSLLSIRRVLVLEPAVVFR